MSDNKIIEFKNIIHLNNITLGEVELKIGKNYWLGKTYVRFTKVTRKGFNFLNEQISRCLLKITCILNTTLV